MSGKLKGKIAVETGGSAGIGFGAARRFAEEGARMFITGLRQAVTNSLRPMPVQDRYSAPLQTAGFSR